MSRNTTFVVTTLASCLLFVILVATHRSLGWAVVTSLWCWPVFFFICLGVEKLLAKREVTILRSPNARWIILGIGVIILITGIASAITIWQRGPFDYYSLSELDQLKLNVYAQTTFNEKWVELTSQQQHWLLERYPDLANMAKSIQQAKNIRQKEWFIKWVVIPTVAFFVLTAAIVTSRVILDKFVLKPEQKNKPPGKMNRQ